METSGNNLPVEFLNAPIMRKQIQVPDETPPITFELGPLWNIYEAILAIGMLNVSSLVAVGWTARTKQELAHIEQDFDQARQALDFEEYHAFMRRFNNLVVKTLAVASTIAPESDEERVLAFTYGLLKQQQLTHAEAAEFASLVLSKPIKRDTWRLHLARWAEEHGLPPLELKRGRSPSKQ